MKTILLSDSTSTLQTELEVTDHGGWHAKLTVRCLDARSQAIAQALHVGYRRQLGGRTGRPSWWRRLLGMHGRPANLGLSIDGVSGEVVLVVTWPLEEACARALVGADSAG